ncbi:hypothetical protein V2G26_006435 [Clonostachys chloroleuca]
MVGDQNTKPYNKADGSEVKRRFEEAVSYPSYPHPKERHSATTVIITYLSSKSTRKDFPSCHLYCFSLLGFKIDFFTAQKQKKEKVETRKETSLTYLWINNMERSMYFYCVFPHFHQF